MCCTTGGLVYGWGWAAAGQLGQLSVQGSSICLTADLSISAASKVPLDHAVSRGSTDATSQQNSHKHFHMSQPPAAHLLQALDGHSVLVLSKQHKALAAHGSPVLIDTACVFGNVQTPAANAVNTRFTHCARTRLRADCCAAAQELSLNASGMKGRGGSCVVEHNEHGLCVLNPLEILLPHASECQAAAPRHGVMHQEAKEGSCVVCDAGCLSKSTAVGVQCAWHARSVHAADWHTVIIMHPPQHACIAR